MSLKPSEHQATFVAGLDFFTSSLKRFRDARGPSNICSSSGDPDRGASLEDAVQHIASRNRTDAGGLEQLADFRMADHFLLENGGPACPSWPLPRLQSPGRSRGKGAYPRLPAPQWLFAVTSGRTLKPITMALDAAARVTSDSLMAPTRRV